MGNASQFVSLTVNIKKLALRMRQIQENKESKEVDDNNSPPNRKLNFRACESLVRYERKYGQGEFFAKSPSTGRPVSSDASLIIDFSD